MKPDEISAIADSIVAVTAVVGAYFGVKQLGILAAEQRAATHELRLTQINTRLNWLNSVVEIEKLIAECKRNFDQCSTQVQVAQAEEKKPEELKAICAVFECAKEDYLNAVERLCFCLLKGYVPEENWAAEYRNYLLNIIKQFPHAFGPASPYTNIKDLHEQWQRK